jgi:phage terminase small subunit
MALTSKQQRFVAEYLIDSNATQAAIRSGYSARTAAAIGSENLTKPEIAAAIQATQVKTSEDLGITHEWILGSLKQNAERAMQVEPVLDRHGNPTGEYVYQGHVANKALELLGKNRGMFADKMDHSHTGKVTVNVVYARE